ncbi:MAG: hypothetical protein RLZZ157_616 [Pseudomonadota bacterium]
MTDATLPPLPQTARKPRPPTPGRHGLDARLAEMLRVDHAGEFAATQIYAGQRAVFSRVASARKITAQLAHQEADETKHKAAFDAVLREKGVRPTLLSPIWGVAAYGLGVVTALMGEKAAHACTVAVEEVIEGHYLDQLHELGDAEPELAAMIGQFRDEEIAHKDQALAEGAKDAFAHPVLDGIIKAGCRAAIAISQKV